MSIEVIAPASRSKIIFVRIEQPDWQDYIIY